MVFLSFFFFLEEQQSQYCESIKPVLSPAPGVGFSMITGSSKLSELSPWEYRLAHRTKTDNEMGIRPDM